MYGLGTFFFYSVIGMILYDFVWMGMVWYEFKKSQLSVYRGSNPKHYNGKLTAAPLSDMKQTKEEK